MEIVQLLFILGTVVVGLQSILLILGWRKIQMFQSSEQNLSTKTTVIIAARNEEKNISSCLQKISEQDFPQHLLEVIVVDDHSEDNTSEVVRSFNKKNNLPVKLIELKEEGKSSKKSAIQAAVNAAEGTLIVSTDADCIMGNKWLKTLVSFYEKNSPDLISAPVVFSNEKSFFEKLQSFEFIGLIGSGASFIGLNLPVMCNGANLAYTKKIFLEANAYESNLNISSGDDAFLLHEIVKQKGKISFLKSGSAIVSTQSEITIGGFLNQRIRWASKNFRTINLPLMLAGSAVAYVNTLVVFGLFYLIFVPHFLALYLTFILLKCVADGFVFNEFTGFFNKKSLLFLLLPAQYFFAGYSLIVLLASLSGSYTWKGRKTS